MTSFVWLFLAFMLGGLCGITAMALVVMGKRADEIKVIEDKT